MSIIGTPIMVGGGGGFWPSIRVDGLSSTDTVTATKGSKTLTAAWRAVPDSTTNAWYFEKIPEFGTWTVTATDGTETTTQEVLVDAATEYAITMGYDLYLYNEGDECEEVTGGWEANKASLTGRTATGTATKEANALYANGPDNKDASFSTAQKIDCSGYSSIRMTVSDLLPTNNQAFVAALFASASDMSNSAAAEFRQDAKANGTTIFDISEITGSYYVAVGTGGGRSGRVNKLWLE